MSAIEGDQSKVTRIRHANIKSLEKCNSAMKCQEYGARFLNKGDLKKHLRTHSGEKPYTCQQCGVGFSQNGNTYIHSYCGKTLKCQKCESGFSQRNHLKYHMLKNTYKKCKEIFSCCMGLKRHVPIHTEKN